MNRRRSTRTALAHSRGFVLAYLLFTLALAAIVTVGLSQIRSTDVQAQQVSLSVNRLVRSVEIIRGQVIHCAVAYPAGASVTVPTVGTITTQYPVLPDGATGYKTGTGDASTMQCPGAPDGQNHLWSGRDTVFYPEPGSGFDPWQYTIVVSGPPLTVTEIKLTLANASGGTGLAAMRRIVQRFPGGTVSLNEAAGVLTVELLTAAP